MPAPKGPKRGASQRGRKDQAAEEANGRLLSLAPDGRPVRELWAQGEVVGSKGEPTLRELLRCALRDDQAGVLKLRLQDVARDRRIAARNALIQEVRDSREQEARIAALERFAALPQEREQRRLRVEANEQENRRIQATEAVIARDVVVSDAPDRTSDVTPVHDEEADEQVTSIRERLVGSAEPALRALKVLRELDEEWVPRSVLGSEIGIPATSVDEDHRKYGSGATRKGGQAGRGPVCFKTEYLVGFVVRRWNPRVRGGATPPQPRTQRPQVRTI